MSGLWGIILNRNYDVTSYIRSQIEHICSGCPFLRKFQILHDFTQSVWRTGFFLVCNCIFWSMHVVNLYFAVTTIAILQNKMLLLAPCCFLYDLISPPCLFIMTSNLPEAKKQSCIVCCSYIKSLPAEVLYQNIWI